MSGCRTGREAAFVRTDEWLDGVHTEPVFDPADGNRPDRARLRARLDELVAPMAPLKGRATAELEFEA